MPHLLDIANRPTVLTAGEGIFGCKPTIGYMTAWWSVPTADGNPRQAENFHRDMDNFHFLKLLIFLSDVGPENEPHEFIRGSHDIALLCDLRRQTDDEVLSTFGADRLIRFTRPAGTSFIENTFGMHRGQPVHSGRRLILQIVYSMLRAITRIVIAVSRQLGRVASFAGAQMLFPESSDAVCHWSTEVKYPENITLGKRVVIGTHCTIGATVPIYVEDDVLLSKGVFIDTRTIDTITPPPFARSPS